MGMEIKLDAEAAAAVASQAIWETLSEQAREDILKQAITYLMTPDSGRAYGTKQTPLQNAFNTALQAACYRAVEEKVKNDPEVQAHIQELLGPLLIGAVREQSANYNDGLADKLGVALGQWLAENTRNS